MKLRSVRRQFSWRGDVIKENEWDYNPRVNFFWACYSWSVKTMIWQQNRCSMPAICGMPTVRHIRGHRKRRTEYALLAAAFAALFLSEDNALGKEEAAEVLQKSSVQLADISGITYALEHAVEESSRAALNRIIRSIGVDHGKTMAELQDMQALLESLRYLFPGNAVRKKKSPNCRETL